MRIVYVDADGCAVKEEVYKVARRYDLLVRVVSNKAIRIPASERIEAVVVGNGFDEADDWIVEHVAEDDVVVTTDIPLAARCIKKGARVLSAKGRTFEESDIGDALASRALKDYLRSMGMDTGGPAPMTPRDRSRFLSALDETIQKIRRGSSRT